MANEKLEVKELTEKELEDVSGAGPLKATCPLNKGNKRCNYQSKAVCPVSNREHIACCYD